MENVNSKVDFCDLVETIDALVGLLPGAFVAFGIEKKMWCRVVSVLLPVLISSLRKICTLISDDEDA